MSLELTSKKRVLLVEDNEINVRLFVSLLRSPDIEVVVCGSGESAIAEAQNSRFDLILMDIGLPGMTGIEATRALKVNPVTRETPVIAVSAFAFAEEQEQALLAGCHSYVTKPVQVRQFRKMILDFFSLPENPLPAKKIASQLLSLK